MSDLGGEFDDNKLSEHEKLAKREKIKKYDAEKRKKIMEATKRKAKIETKDKVRPQVISSDLIRCNPPYI